MQKLRLDLLFIAYFSKTKLHFLNHGIFMQTKFLSYLLTALYQV